MQTQTHHGYEIGAPISDGLHEDYQGFAEDITALCDEGRGRCFAWESVSTVRARITTDGAIVSLATAISAIVLAAIYAAALWMG